MDYISVSSIAQFVHCQYCWKLHYLDGKEMPSSPAAQYGSDYHAHVDAYHKGLEHDGEFIKAYTARIPKEYRLESELTVIERLKLNGSETKVPVKMILDGVTATGLCDLKTGCSRPGPTLQTDTYGAWYLMTKGKEPQFTLNWLDKRRQKLLNIVFTVTQREAQDAIEFINYVIDQIAKTDFMEPSEYRYHHPECIWTK